MLVTTHTTLCLAWLERRPATHRLHNISILIKSLEIERRTCWHTEECRAILIDISHTPNLLQIPRCATYARRCSNHCTATFTATGSLTYGSCTKLDLYHSQLLDCARLDTLQTATFVDVLHIIHTIVAGIINC